MLPDNNYPVFFFVVYCSTLRQGMHDLRIWPDQKPDTSLPSATPGKSSHDKMSQLFKVGNFL